MINRKYLVLSILYSVKYKQLQDISIKTVAIIDFAMLALAKDAPKTE